MEEPFEMQTPTPETIEEVAPIPQKSSKKGVVIGIIAVVAIALIVGAVFLILHLTTHPIDRFADKLVKSESFHMEMVMSADIGITDVTANFDVKVDGNLAYVSINIPGYMDYDMYFETKGTITYQYVKENGTWIKSIYEDESVPLETSNEVLAILDPDNYDEVKGEKNTYRQKRNVVFDSFEDVLIIIDGDEMIIEATMEEIPNCHITFSDVGSTNVSLPKSGD